MKKIAIGKLCIDLDELKDLFNVPQEVTILDASIDNYGMIEFKIATSEPIDGLTLAQTVEGYSNIRRIRVSRKGAN